MAVAGYRLVMVKYILELLFWPILMGSHSWRHRIHASLGGRRSQLSLTHASLRVVGTPTKLSNPFFFVIVCMLAPNIRTYTVTMDMAHALALDEHWIRFNPSFWTHPTENELKLGTQPGDMPKSAPRTHKEKTLRGLEWEHTDGGAHYIDVEEVWFAGCHCGKVLYQ